MARGWRVDAVGDLLGMGLIGAFNNNIITHSHACRRRPTLARFVRWRIPPGDVLDRRAAPSAPRMHQSLLNSHAYNLLMLVMCSEDGGSVLSQTMAR